MIVSGTQDINKIHNLKSQIVTNQVNSGILSVRNYSFENLTFNEIQLVTYSVMSLTYDFYAGF